MKTNTFLTFEIVKDLKRVKLKISGSSMQAMNFKSMTYFL